MKNKLKGRDIKVASAGLTALVDKPADQMAKELASQNGIDMSAHKGQQVNTSLVAQNSVILVMEQRHLEDLCSRYPQARGKTFLLGKWLGDKEIPDPYRQSREAFEHVYDLIDSACGAWQKYL
ncbi:protein-tyrosine phosphatase [Pseudoalteromonas rubra]|uniref:protein-tyrosine-phosphatase n=1 Tax=Pseudoalteromonas rubra TaxID=43658 RepID=A0A8T0CC18_9GAMM|nr:protein-tyrosine phosphatase [Pseudoalteromonas rubra]